MATHSSTEIRLNGYAPGLRLNSAVGILIVINVAVWLLCSISRFTPYGLAVADLLTLPASFRGAGHEPWTPATYMVTHFSAVHLLINMLLLWWFGSIAEKLSGARTVALLYVGGGLAGALLFLCAVAAGVVPGDLYSRSGLLTLAGDRLTGASGAVLAVLTYVTVIAGNRRLNHRFFGNIRLVWLGLAFIVLSFIDPNSSDTFSGAVVAHLGGILFGLCWALAIRVRKHIDTGQMHKMELRMSGRNPRYSVESSDESASGYFDAAKTRDNNRARLDALLDKIRVSGYDSLTHRERQELELLSKHV